MTNTPSGASSGPPSAFLARRLALEPDTPPPTILALGLQPAKAAAFAWQEQRSQAFWNEVGAMTATAASDWVRSIHGIIGAVGEEVLVAIEAEVEKAIARDLLGKVASDDYVKRAVYFRSLRFFAEGQGNALVVAAHGITNLTVRTFALDPKFKVSAVTAKPLNMKEKDFTPKSTARSAWLSFNKTTVIALKTVAVELHPKMQMLAEELDAVASDAAFTALVALRDVHYHRWRGESPGVTGINFQGDTVREQLDQEQAVGISAQLLPDYVEGEQLLNDVVTTTRTALDALVGHMPNLLQAWCDAFQEVRS